MEDPSTQSDPLWDCARGGDVAAQAKLLQKYRGRIRRLAEVRLDDRVTARVDASDVVQDTLAEALGKIGDYFRDEPVPFYIWLRQIAVEQLVDVHRKHVQAQKRTVEREDPLLVSNASMQRLGELLACDGTTPSAGAVRGEALQRVRTALGKLDVSLREVLVMKYLEQLSSSEIAAALGVSVRTVQARHLQAIKELRSTLDREL